VTAEAERRFSEDVSAHSGSLVDRLKPMSGGRFGDIVSHDVDAQVRAAMQAYPGFIADLRSRVGVEVEAWPNAPHEEVAGRDLRQMLPFRKLKGGSIGYRDTLVWLTTLDIARRHPDDDVVLVSANGSDYADATSARRGDDNSDRVEGRSSVDYALSRPLRAEAARLLGEHHRVRLAKDLPTLADVYLPAAEQAVTERTEPKGIRELLDADPDARAAILSALWEVNDRIREFEIVPQYNPREGDYDDADVDLHLPNDVTDATLKYIEGPFDLVIEDVRADDSDTVSLVQTRHRVTLSFDGFLAKSDYAGSDDDEIEVRDYDWNDHMMHVGFERDVFVTSSVEFVRQPRFEATVTDDGLQLTLDTGQP
jgi:hypothetical protein